uniref:Uncharacterized protein n=1 Tax=Oryza punctata TaxID=4537 RepID=A0A0E0JT26_ORYPU
MSGPVSALRVGAWRKASASGFDLGSHTNASEESVNTLLVVEEEKGGVFVVSVSVFRQDMSRMNKAQAENGIFNQWRN